MTCFYLGTLTNEIHGRACPVELGAFVLVNGSPSERTCGDLLCCHAERQTKRVPRVRLQSESPNVHLDLLAFVGVKDVVVILRDSEDVALYCFHVVLSLAVTSLPHLKASGELVVVE